MGLAVTKQEAFWEACGFGHTNRVKKFIEDGIDVNWVSYTHNSCAIHVASQGKEQIVQMLLDAKCNVNVKDDRGNLALHHAAMKGHAKIMQMLIDAGSEIDTQDKNGWTPLLNAAYFCQPDAVETLVKNNCDVHLLTKDERTALHEACRSHSRDNNGVAITVCHLVEAGADVNLKSSDVGEADFTSLMFASYHGHAEAAEVIVEAGCDINAQGTNGWTALHWAVDRGHTDVARVLLECGIDPLLEGRRGELALHRAKDNELRDGLEEVTSQAKYERYLEEMVSRSPVSTTSPLSSSNESLSSDLNDADNVNNRETEKDIGKEGEDIECLEVTEESIKVSPVNNDIIDNDLVAKLEAVAMERDSKESESSCTSGTVSEKDEKEALEKDVIGDNLPNSLPDDSTIICDSSTGLSSNSTIMSAELSQNISEIVEPDLSKGSEEGTDNHTDDDSKLEINENDMPNEKDGHVDVSPTTSQNEDMLLSGATNQDDGNIIDDMIGEGFSDRLVDSDLE